jgi:hypothetical protein
MKPIRMNQIVAVEVDGASVLGTVIGINRVCDPPRYLVRAGQALGAPEVIVSLDQLSK